MDNQSRERASADSPHGPITTAQSSPSARQSESSCHSIVEMLTIALSIFGSFTISLSMFVSSILLAKKPISEQNSVDFLAAIADIPPFFNTVFFIALSLSLGIPPIANALQGKLQKAITEASSENDIDILRENIAYTNRAALIMAAIMSIFASIAFLFAKEIYLLTGRSEATATYIGTFMFPWVFGIPAALLRVALEQNLFPSGKQRDVIIVDSILFTIASIFAYLFVFGYFGEQWSNIESISWCYAIENHVTLIFNSLYMSFHNDLKKFNFFRTKYTDPSNSALIKPIFSQSMSKLLNITIEFALSFTMTVLTGLTNSISQAAFSYSMQLFSLTLLLAEASSLAGSQVVGNAIGNENYPYASRLICLAIFFSLASTILPSLITMFYPKWLIIAFSRLELNINSTSLRYNITTPLSSQEISEQIEGENEIFARETSLIIILDTLRYSLMFLGAALGTPWVTLIFLTIAVFLGIGLSITLGLNTDSGIAGNLAGWILALATIDLMLSFHITNLRKPALLTSSLQRLETTSCSMVKRIFCGCKRKFDIEQRTDTNIEMRTFTPSSGTP